MARKRMIDPEFWSDEEIGRWTHSARLFYIGLWNFADDCGRFKANLGLLKSQIFPTDDPKRVKIRNYQKEIGNKIVWYEINGSHYGYLRNLLKHQRIDKPQPSKIPPPPNDKFVDNSQNNQRTVLPNIKEENIREENTPAKSAGQEKSIFNDKEKELLVKVSARANIYAIMEEFKHVHKVYPPKELLLRVCRQYLDKGSTITDPYPYLKAALHRAAQDEDNLNWKKQGMPECLKSILMGAIKNV